MVLQWRGQHDIHSNISTKVPTYHGIVHQMFLTHFIFTIFQFNSYVNWQAGLLWSSISVLKKRQSTNKQSQSPSWASGMFNKQVSSFHFEIWQTPMYSLSTVRKPRWRARFSYSEQIIGHLSSTTISGNYISLPAKNIYV